MHVLEHAAHAALSVEECNNFSDPDRFFLPSTGLRVHTQRSEGFQVEYSRYKCYHLGPYTDKFYNTFFMAHDQFPQGMLKRWVDKFQV